MKAVALSEAEAAATAVAVAARATVAIAARSAVTARSPVLAWRAGRRHLAGNDGAARRVDLAIGADLRNDDIDHVTDGDDILDPLDPLGGELAGERAGADRTGEDENLGAFHASSDCLRAVISLRICPRCQWCASSIGW